MANVQDYAVQRIKALSLYGEHCQKIAVSIPTQAGQRFISSKTWCDRQQLRKAVITGDTVTRLSIPIRGHGYFPINKKKARGEIWPKRTEERNNTKTTKMRTKKSAVNKKLILRLWDCSIWVQTPVTLLCSLSNTFTESITHTLSLQLWVKQYHFCSSMRMALVLNNPWRLICQ